MKRIFTSLILLFFIPQWASSQDIVDFGIAEGAQSGQVELRIRPNFDCSLYLTNMQFTVKWPVVSGLSLNPGMTVFPYNLLSQGQFQDNGFYYHVFASTGGNNVSWLADSVYVCATFDYTGAACSAFEIAADAWTAANNGDYYIEINGLDKTGFLYAAAVDVGEPPATPVITQSGDSLISSAPSGNQWYGTATGLVSGATGQYFIPTVEDDYYVIVSLDSCVSEPSNSIYVIITGITGSLVKEGYLTIFPNPCSTGQLTLDLGKTTSGAMTIDLYDLSGRKLREWHYPEQAGINLHTLDVNSLSPGSYMLRVEGNGINTRAKLVLQN